jgi:hypothetical protein
MKLLRAPRARRRAPRSCRPPSLRLAINGRIDVHSKFHDARRGTAGTRMRIGLRERIPVAVRPNHATQRLLDAKPMHTSTGRRKRLNDRQPGTKIFCAIAEVSLARTPTGFRTRPRRASQSGWWRWKARPRKTVLLVAMQECFRSPDGVTMQRSRAIAQSMIFAFDQLGVVVRIE